MIRLMIVDDEKIIRETIKSFINWKALGVEIVGTCKDGIEAYNTILDEYPDIVLTDIKMPGFTGLELIERIRQIDKSIEFIILTGYEEFSFAKQAMKFGIRHYLLKPCNENQIVEAVKDIQKQKQKNPDWNIQSEKIWQTYEKNVLQNEIVSAIEQLVQNISKSDDKDRKKIFHNIDDELKKITDKDFLVSFISSLLIRYADSSDIAYNPMQIMDYVMKLKRFDSSETVRTSFVEILPQLFPENIIGINKTDSLIKKILDYIDEHIEEPGLSLKQISEQCLFMNVDYVSKKFVKQTGFRFSDFLNRRRVEKAKQFLTCQADVQIPYVAEKIGFGNNPQYFYLIFKKYTGMTPAAYINSWKNKK